jgi:hypothetical protein
MRSIRIRCVGMGGGMVDAAGLKPAARKGVRVRVPSCALDFLLLRSIMSKYKTNGFPVRAKLHELDGEKKSLRDWCLQFDRNYETVWHRMRRGIPLKEALETEMFPGGFARLSVEERKEMSKRVREAKLVKETSIKEER